MSTIAAHRHDPARYGVRLASRRGVAALALFLGGIATGGVVMAQSSADAFSTGYGGAELGCVVIPYYYPQYGISGAVTYCGVYRHEGGPRQT